MRAKKLAQEIQDKMERNIDRGILMDTQEKFKQDEEERRQISKMKKLQNKEVWNEQTTMKEKAKQVE